MTRIPDVVVAEREAGNPGVVRVRHRSGLRDACHAVLSTLSAEARTVSSRARWEGPRKLLCGRDRCGSGQRYSFGCQWKGKNDPGSPEKTVTEHDFLRRTLFGCSGGLAQSEVDEIVGRAEAWLDGGNGP